MVLANAPAPHAASVPVEQHRGPTRLACGTSWPPDRMASGECHLSMGGPPVIPVDDTSFIHDICQARKARGLSIRALATTAGVGFSSWARCERGEGAPSPHTRYKLQAWLDGRTEMNCLCRRCVKRIPHGWQCPLCACVYAPTVLYCAKCNREESNPFYDL